jgi:hypothetical protein
VSQISTLRHRHRQSGAEKPIGTYKKFPRHPSAEKNLRHLGTRHSAPTFLYRISVDQDLDVSLYHEVTIEGDSAYIAKVTTAQQWAEQLHNPGTKLTEEDIPEEYKRHTRVFSEEHSKALPPHRQFDHAINLTPDAPGRLDCKIYPLNDREMEELRAFVIKNKEELKIEDSDSQYTFPVFFIKKKDGTYRMIIDYRGLNKYTVPDNYPLPLIETLLKRLRNKTLFTKLDIRWGFNNIRIKEGDEWKAAFKTPIGTFAPTVMQFGMQNAPGTFQRNVNITLRPVSNKFPDDLFNYTDDILIGTDDNLEHHREVVHSVLEALERDHFFLKPSKCEFEQRTIDYLGVRVDQHGTHIDPSKAQGLRDWPRHLKNLKEVRSTLGILGFLRPFIKNFAHIARPITDLLKKDVPFHWGEEQRSALNQLIGIVTSDPVLKQPDTQKPFILEVDASDVASGAILYQKDDRGQLQPVGYHSKAFSDAERNMSTGEKEFTGLMRGLERWAYLCETSPHPIEVWTDHKNLEYYTQPRTVSRKIARWISRLADFNFRLVHRPGRLNHADPLSRNPIYGTGKGDNAETIALPPALFARSSHIMTLEEEILQAQGLHRDQLREWEGLFPITEHSHGWYFGARLIVVGNDELRRGILSHYHDSISAGHPGIARTYDTIATDYWWPNMKHFITNYVKGCARCQATKVNHQPNKPPLYPIPPNDTFGPFQGISLDLITKLPPSDGFDSILTVVDHDCSKGAFFIPCNETVDGPGIAKLYATHIFPHYGLPRKVISDRDPRFTSGFTTELCKVLGIKQNISSAYHPQTDGQSERANQSVEQYLRLYVNEQQDDWAKWLPMAQYTHNSWKNSTTQRAPYQALIGYIPLAHQRHNTSSVDDIDTRLKEVERQRKAGQEHMRLAQDALVKGRRHHVFKEGQDVWLEGRNIATIGTPKLMAKRHGPFRILKQISPVAFRLKLPNHWKIHDVFHASLLTPYRETQEHGKNYLEPPPDIIDGEPEWEIEAITGTRLYRNQRQYRIRWKGYSSAHDSWEAETGIHAPELVQDFLRRYPRAKSTNPIKRRRKRLSTGTQLSTAHFDHPSPSNHSNSHWTHLDYAGGTILLSSDNESLISASDNGDTSFPIQDKDENRLDTSSSYSQTTSHPHTLGNTGASADISTAPSTTNNPPPLIINTASMSDVPSSVSPLPVTAPTSPTEGSPVLPIRPYDRRGRATLGQLRNTALREAYAYPLRARNCRRDPVRVLGQKISRRDYSSDHSTSSSESDVTSPEIHLEAIHNSEATEEYCDIAQRTITAILHNNPNATPPGDVSARTWENLHNIANAKARGLDPFDFETGGVRRTIGEALQDDPTYGVMARGLAPSEVASTVEYGDEVPSRESVHDTGRHGMPDQARRHQLSSRAPQPTPLEERDFANEKNPQDSPPAYWGRDF